MNPALAQRNRIRLSLASLLAGFLSMGLLFSQPLLATPITLQQSFAGNLDFVITGGTLRTQPNSVDPCAVTTGPVTASLSGIPAGATIRSAFLYWGGSGPNIDDQVTLDGNSVFADRVFTENYVEPGVNEFYFGGVSDVTSIVQGKGNGSYSFSGLTVTNTDLSTTQRYCTFGVVYSGWGLVVIYEHPSQPFRVINMYDGLQTFYGSQITLIPDNLRIPAAPVDGKLAILTFEGDSEIATTRNGFTESVRVNGNLLTDALNPANNQYNSTINQLGLNNTHGVDFDIYNIDSFINPGDTSLTTQYSSGGDWVQLMLQVVSATSDPASDLSIQKRRNGLLQAGLSGQYRITVSNNGPMTEPGPIVVTDTLDGRLTFDGFSGGGWNCGAAGQNVTCSHPGPLTVNNSLPDLFLDVIVQSGTGGQSISNTATVSGQNFDNISANNSDTTTGFIYGPVTGVKRLYPFFSAAQGVPANSLSRVLPTTNTDSGTFGPGLSRTLTLTPALARTLAINGGAVPIPVRICSRRQGTGNSGNRSMRVSLAYTIGATTTAIGTPQTTSVNNTAWTLRTFNFALPSNLTLPPGAQLRVLIENTTPTGAGSRLIQASSLSCVAGDVSRIELDVETVINVEGVAVHSVAYPAENTITTAVDNGSTLYVRSLISDPFGSFDITSAEFDLFDSDDNLVAGPIAKTLVNDDVANGERTYELSFTTPDWENSPYTLRVRGNEGSEVGVLAIFSFGATGLTVTPQPPLLMVTKVANSPTVNPGSVVSYTVQVSNAGTGAATGVEVIDMLSRFLSLGIDTFAPGEPVEFVDGSPSSELTPEPVEYSNDGGATYIYAPVSGGGGAPAGYDSNITHFRIPFTGNMPPGGSFTLNYDAIVD